MLFSAVADLVCRHILAAHLLLPGRGSLQLPVVQAVQEHLGQVVPCKDRLASTIGLLVQVLHHLPLLGGEVVELVEHEVGDALGDAWLLVGRVAEGPLYTGLGQLQDTPPQQLEQVEVHLPRGRIKIQETHKNVLFMLRKHMILKHQPGP